MARTWVKEREREGERDSEILERSWRVTVDAGKVVRKGLRVRLEPYLVVLKNAGREHADATEPVTASDAAVKSAIEALLSGRRRGEGIRNERPAVRRIFVPPMAGGRSSGSEEALSILEQYMAVRADNRRKLAEAGTDERHLFIWLDDNIPREVSLRFMTLVAADAVNFALLARVPVPRSLTLWVVHERRRRGWRWSATTGWQGVAGGER